MGTKRHLLGNSHIVDTLTLCVVVLPPDGCAKAGLPTIGRRHMGSTH